MLPEFLAPELVDVPEQVKNGPPCRLEEPSWTVAAY
jgi:hypothetical protein